MPAWVVLESSAPLQRIALPTPKHEATAAMMRLRNGQVTGRIVLTADAA